MVPHASVSFNPVLYLFIFVGLRTNKKSICVRFSSTKVANQIADENHITFFLTAHLFSLIKSLTYE